MDSNPERQVYLARRREALYRWLSTDSPEDSPPFDDPDSLDFMTALVGDYLPSKGWTEEALEQIPDGIRYEIEDGNLVVSPRPTLWHQEACSLLKTALQAGCPAQWWPVQEGEIRMPAEATIDQLRAPDVMVVPRSLVDPDAVRGWARTDEVLVAAEVVSAGSRTNDRVTKVNVYASWGIQLYLRLESKPRLALYEYRLDSKKKAYLEPVEHSSVFETDDPFPIRIDLDSWR